MRKGKRLAIDVGSVRIGLASCDADGILANPLPALARSSKTSDAVSSIVELVSELDAIEVIVGDPVSMSGSVTRSTSDARNLAIEIATAISIPVRMVDERLTTVSAQNKLRQSGKDSRQAKAFIDSASAVEILEQALSIEKASGKAPGTLAVNLDD
jgi:putative holliday junction resolvase